MDICVFVESEEGVNSKRVSWNCTKSFAPAAVFGVYAS